ncbi:MAG: PIN domain-containing protein, partial [Chloroflexota bacterium]|nr:PIN domain-containing protein [Chloroflexota bacterium]
LAYPSVKTVDRELLYRTIEVFEVHRLDFADAYLIACAEASGVGAVASFDRDLDGVGTVECIEP